MIITVKRIIIALLLCDLCLGAIHYGYNTFFKYLPGSSLFDVDLE